MLQLRAFAPADRAASIGARLADVDGVRHVIVGGRTTADMVQLTSEVDDDAADDVLSLLGRCDIAAADVILWRTARIRPLGWRRGATALGHVGTVWAEVTGRASDHARLTRLALLLMGAAGVVAGVGVLDGSSILVVGAMALSPDLLPICAAAIGIVERRGDLAARAILTLGIGLATAGLTAAGATVLLRALDRVGGGLELADTALGLELTSIGPGAVLVALVAGMAGMLAYETAAGAAVGVAISVTTIPAAAYLGCALGLGTTEHFAGALAVLGTNVTCILAGSALTLRVQRRRRRLASGPDELGLADVHDEA
jgi:uncharacterized hydrophobic protein (TIGR00271 family)